MSLWLSFDGEGYEELPHFEDMMFNGIMRMCFSEPDKVVHWGLMAISCGCFFLQIYPPYTDEDLFRTIFARCEKCKQFIRTKPSADEMWLYCVHSLEASFIFIRSDITEDEMKEVEEFKKESDKTIYLLSRKKH